MCIYILDYQYIYIVKVIYIYILDQIFIHTRSLDYPTPGFTCDSQLLDDWTIHPTVSSNMGSWKNPNGFFFDDIPMLTVLSKLF